MFAFMISAFCSGSGKTVVTSGVNRALVRRGLDIAPYKCGPDYIDAIWQSRAGRRPAYNLDSVLMAENELAALFDRTSAGCDGAVAEGVMGFFDGLNPISFKGSSYNIAKILNIPVVLVIDAGNLAASAAAIVAGIKTLAPDVKFAGVIVNKIKSSGQEAALRKALSAHVPDISVLGTLPVEAALAAPSRHLGLSISSTDEHEEFFEAAADLVEKYVDLNGIVSMTGCTSRHSGYRAGIRSNGWIEGRARNDGKDKMNKHITAAVACDDAFNFYYQSTFDLLEQLGYEIKKFSPLADEAFDNADLLLLGGGYPEIYADKLSTAINTKRSIFRHFSEDRPIFAECGGFVYLTNSLKTDSGLYPMTRIFDAECEMTAKRQRLGYVHHTYTGMPGHLFHYSRVKSTREQYRGEAQRLSAEESYPDGFLKGSAYGGYTHFMPTEKSKFFINFIKGSVR